MLRGQSKNFDLMSPSLQSLFAEVVSLCFLTFLSNCKFYKCVFFLKKGNNNRFSGHRFCSSQFNSVAEMQCRFLELDVHSYVLSVPFAFPLHLIALCLWAASYRHVHYLMSHFLVTQHLLIAAPCTLRVHLKAWKKQMEEH